jgi:hypothetical protein
MMFKLEGHFVFFATNNINKFNEARRILAEYNIATAMLRVKNIEIQSDHLEEIAKTSAKDAFSISHLPIIVEEDVGETSERLPPGQHDESLVKQPLFELRPHPVDVSLPRVMIPAVQSNLVTGAIGRRHDPVRS